MFIEEVDSVTLLTMGVALEQICHRFPDEKFRAHEARYPVAQAILACVQDGERTLNGMLLAGGRVALVKVGESVPGGARGLRDVT